MTTLSLSWTDHGAFYNMSIMWTFHFVQVKHQSWLHFFATKFGGLDMLNWSLFTLQPSWPGSRPGNWRLYRTHISETNGRIFSVRSSLELSRLEVVHRHDHLSHMGLPIMPMGPKLVKSGWVGVGGFSKVVATFNHVGGSFNLFLATTGDVWIIPSFRIWDWVLHIEHVSCVITNCGQHQWVIPSPLSITL